MCYEKTVLGLGYSVSQESGTLLGQYVAWKRGIDCFRPYQCVLSATTSKEGI